MRRPGTQAFAETVLPFVQNHNTILLANHGVVCWSDTVTHAEWLTEILESYCKTYLIAKQIGKPLTHIPEEKIQEILALKRKLGFPDARMEPLAAPDAANPPVNPGMEEAGAPGGVAAGRAVACCRRVQFHAVAIVSSIGNGDLPFANDQLTDRPRLVQRLFVDAPLSAICKTQPP